MTLSSAKSWGVLDAFPGVACPMSDGLWRVQVMGQLRRPYQTSMRKRLLIRVLGNLMQASDEELEGPFFRARVEPFVTDGWGGVPIICDIGGREVPLSRPTHKNGHFSQWIAVDDDTMQRALVGSAAARLVTFGIRAESQLTASSAATTGQSFLLRDQGVSVVSDVDDTIKLTVIGERRELLANTFLREFREIAGMSEVYREWAKRGFDFHYVSSSPWQLFGPLWQLLESNGFPLGSVHLRTFRLRNHVLQRMVRIRRSGKSRAIRELLRAMPQRSIVMIGDSGEKDLEIYTKIAACFPGQVKAILIRNLPDQWLSEKRLDRCRRRLGSVPCFTFSDAAELADKSSTCWT